MSLRYHPDRFFNSNEELKNIATKKFQLVGKAYSILIDKEKKAIYDETGLI